MPTLHQQQQQLQQQQQQHHQLQSSQHQQEQLTSNQQWGPFKVYSNPDTLICGNCRECFNELAELLDHKRSYCKLRFTCKCQDVAFAAKTAPTSAKLLCAMCKDAFVNPWDLMVHAQAAHMVNIYELGNEANNNGANCGAAILADTAPNVANSNSNNSNNNNNGSQNYAAAKEAQQVANALHKDTNSITSNNNCNSNSNNVVQMSPTTGTTKAMLENVDNSSDMATISVVGAIAGIEADANGNNNNNNNTNSNSNTNNNNNSYVADGNVSDTDATHCMDIKFGICNSPHGSIAKEDAHRDDASLDGRMSSSSHTHHSDDMKLLNGSLSSRGSSPALDGEEQPQQQQPARACIVRTLSIEAASASTGNSHTATLGLMTNSLGLSLTNGAASAAAAIAPQ